MLHKMFTNQELSKHLKTAGIASIATLLAILFQKDYAPHAVMLEKIINLIHHISFLVMALIIVSQTLILFRKNHPQLIAHYNTIALSIELFLATIVFLMLTVTHHIKSSFIEFYETESITHHHNNKKITYLLIFITIMLIYDLYKTIKEDNKKINDKMIKEIISKETHTLIKDYLIIAASLFGLIHIKTFHQFAISCSNYIQSTLIFYSDIFGYIIVTIWIIALFYYVYKTYFGQKN